MRPRDGRRRAEREEYNDDEERRLHGDDFRVLGMPPGVAMTLVLGGLAFAAVALFGTVFGLLWMERQFR